MPINRLPSRSAMSLNGLSTLAPGESITPLRSKGAPALKCASCAAPLAPHEARCSYCMSWNPDYCAWGRVDAIEVTNLDDPVPRYLVGGALTTAEVREQVNGRDGVVGARWVAGIEAPIKPAAVLEAPGTISESERRAIEVLWRDRHSPRGLVDRIAAMVFGRKA